MNTVLKASELKKSFHFPAEVEILKGVSLEARAGESIAIMGASGEGKSTLLNILGTLEDADSGLLEIAGQNVGQTSADVLRNRHIGFVFQSFHLLQDYTVIDNLLMPARIGRRPTHRGSAAHRRAEELLNKVGLEDRKDFNTKLLSGGEKQRVALARALLNNPDLILADEPSGNLDRQTSQRIHDLLFHFVKEQNKALIVVTHDQELADLCDHLYILREGQLNPCS